MSFFFFRISIHSGSDGAFTVSSTKKRQPNIPPGQNDKGRMKKKSRNKKKDDSNMPNTNPTKNTESADSLTPLAEFERQEPAPSSNTSKSLPSKTSKPVRDYSAEVHALETRIAQIKKHNDYDMNDVLMKELKQLRKQVRDNRAEVHALETRIAQIKAHDDYDMNDLLMKELKQLRKRYRSLLTTSTTTTTVDTAKAALPEACFLAAAEISNMSIPSQFDKVSREEEELGSK